MKISNNPTFPIIAVEAISIDIAHAIASESESLLKRSLLCLSLREFANSKVLVLY